MSQKVFTRLISNPLAEIAATFYLFRIFRTFFRTFQRFSRMIIFSFLLVAKSTLYAQNAFSTQLQHYGFGWKFLRKLKKKSERKSDNRTYYRTLLYHYIIINARYSQANPISAIWSSNAASKLIWKFTFFIIFWLDFLEFSRISRNLLTIPSKFWEILESSMKS